MFKTHKKNRHFWRFFVSGVMLYYFFVAVALSVSAAGLEEYSPLSEGGVVLACGGADDPSNMQWQSVAEGKAKDKLERKGRKTGNSGSHSYSGSSQTKSRGYQTGSGSYQTGPRGGCFTYSASGEKRYVDRSKCR